VAGIFTVVLTVLHILNRMLVANSQRSHPARPKNTSTPPINQRINFHMSAIKQINQYWFMQLIFFFVVIEFQGAVRLTGSVGFGFG
jgi:hypothetical protein